MRCWEKFKATMKPTDDKDYKRRMTRGFVAIASFLFILQWSGLAIGSLFGGMKTVWVRQGFAKYQIICNESEQPDFIIDSISNILDILA